MQHYNSTQKYLNQKFIPPIANICLSYLGDPIKKWQKNLFKDVLKDIRQWSKLEFKKDDKNKISYYYPMYCTSYLAQWEEKFNESVAYQIKNRHVKYCSTCKKVNWISDFNGYKTCDKCRRRAKWQRMKKKIHKKFMVFIERINANPNISHNEKFERYKFSLVYEEMCSLINTVQPLMLRLNFNINFSYDVDSDKSYIIVIYQSNLEE